MICEISVGRKPPVSSIGQALTYRVTAMKDCGVPDKSERIAAILEKIPRLDEDAAPLWVLCPSGKRDDHSCTNCVLGILALLRVFDAVLITQDSSDRETRVKARSETALYFLRSLGQFIRKDLTLTSNWERKGVGQNVSPVQLISSGTQLLHIMEKIRTEEHGDLTPIRKVFVSQAVIKARVKARVKGRRKPMYLVQYDDLARQFQFIGGRRRKSEADPLTVMKREINEELPGNKLAYQEDYDLLELVSNLELTSLSPTFGAFSSYNFTIYQAVFRCPKLVLGHNDKWTTLSELTSGETKDGTPISSEIARKVDVLLPGGLEGLKLSLESVQH